MQLNSFFLSGDPGPGKNNATTLSVLQTTESIPNIILSSDHKSTSVGKTAENAPLVFPQEGFTTLNKTLEKLPSRSIGSTTENSNTNFTKFINSNETTVNITLSRNLTETSNKLVDNTSHPLYKTTDTEVSDLQNVPTPNSNSINLLPVSPKIIYKDNIKPDKSVVLIDNGENTEDQIRAQKSVYQEPHVALVQGQMAAILAGVFLCISIVGYIAMLSWRRYLE